MRRDLTTSTSSFKAWLLDAVSILVLSLFFPLLFIGVCFNSYITLRNLPSLLELREMISLYALMDYIMLALAAKNICPVIKNSSSKLRKWMLIAFLGGYYLFLSYLYIVITISSYLVEIKDLSLVCFPRLNRQHTWISNVFYQIPPWAGITFGILSGITGAVTLGVFCMHAKVQTSDDTKTEDTDILRTLISSVVLLSLVVAFVSITSKEEVIRYAAKHIIAIGAFLVGIVAVSMGSYLRRKPTQDPSIVMLSGLFVFCIGAIIGLTGCHIHNYLFTVFFSMITIFTVGTYCYNPPNWLFGLLSPVKKQKSPPTYIS